MIEKENLWGLCAKRAVFFVEASNEMNEKNRYAMLPEAFRERMRRLLGGDAEEFFNSYEKERAYGLRYNPLKFASVEAFEKNLSQTADWELQPIPWCREGYYYQAKDQPGKHPWHEAGAYYIQEPSAMSAVELLAPKPGEKICDLCAAPGGKTSQIAGKMRGQGLLMANELYASRAKILSQNVERMGISNAVVLNESTERLAQGFPEFFDRILVDAPCSGEGMFRKDPQAVLEWSTQNVELCAKRQHEILCHAAGMLKPGGVLVYSTCTFAPEENEQCIARFLEEYPEFSLSHSILGEQYFSPGIQKWTEAGTIHLGVHETERGFDGAYRLWPHKLHGEGHFAAQMVKDGAGSEKAQSGGCGALRHHKGKQGRTGKKAENAKLEEAYQLYLQFEKKHLNISLQEKMKGKFVLISDLLYLLPEELPDLKGWKMLRAGLPLGACKKNRFEPSHALAICLRSEEACQSVECQDPLKYLHGETIPCDSSLRGWTLVCTFGLPLGWGKAVDGVLKNHYPKGLRICY